jgi:Nucleotidyl transferase AbiEii toxin, Type IV TA system
VIPQRNITLWAQTAPWPTEEQVEQDLLLSRLIVEIANDDYLGDELIFRGGTCLHKLRLVPGLRYSEDLDYVRKSAGGIGELTRALREIGERLGMKVSVEISKYPKVKFRAPFESSRGSMRIKIEVNTYERSPALPLERAPFAAHLQCSSHRPRTPRQLSQQCGRDCDSSPEACDRATRDRCPCTPWRAGCRQRVRPRLPWHTSDQSSHGVTRARQLTNQPHREPEEVAMVT